MRFGWGLLLTVCSAAAAGAPVAHKLTRHVAAPTGDKGGVDQAAVADARKALDDNLSDYPSTRFRGVELVHTRFGIQAFCGELNTKNKLGGYTGWKQFAVTIGDGMKTLPFDRLTISGQPTGRDAFMAQYGSGAASETSGAESAINDLCVEKSAKASLDYSAYLSGTS